MVLAVVGIGLTTVGTLMKNRDMLLWGIPSFVFGAFFACLIVMQWDRQVVKAADEFNKTRDRAYSCTDISNLECQYNKKLWVRDSIEWAERIKVIMEK